MPAGDAFGVLPPVSKLTLPQTMYHFISGYTALVAGTEEGIKEPQATFSACFGAAFIMWHPTKYAEMLAAKMEKHGATAWLVNTGWSGGRSVARAGLACGSCSYCGTGHSRRWHTCWDRGLKSLSIAGRSFPYGRSYGVGRRMKLSYTRKIIDAIHDGSLLNASYSTTPIFNLQVPDSVEGVPSEILHPENSVRKAEPAANPLKLLASVADTGPVASLLFARVCLHSQHFGNAALTCLSLQWADKAAYNATLKKLGQLFVANFEKFADHAVGDGSLTKQILEAGPALA